MDGFLEAYRYAKNLNVFYGSFLTCNFDGVCNQHCRSCTPVPHFTPDGYVSSCDLVTFGEDAHHMDCFVYGRWDEPSRKFVFDQEKIEALKNRTTDNMPHCITCEAREHCGGYCLGEVMNETGSLIGQKPNSCRAIQRLFREIGPVNEPYPYMHP